MISARPAVVAIVTALAGAAILCCPRPPEKLPVSDDHKSTPPVPEAPIPPDYSANPVLALVEASQYGDAKKVEALLVQPFDRATLNKALFAAAQSEPLIFGVDGNGATFYSSDVQKRL